MELELDALPNRRIKRVDDILVGHGLGIGGIFCLDSLVTIEGNGTAKGKITQIVGFELDAVEFIVAAQFIMNLLLSLLLTQHNIAILVTGEFFEEILISEPYTVLLLIAEPGGNLEIGHDRAVLDVIDLALIDNFEGVSQCLGHVGPKFVHLGRSLEPLLLGVAHTGRVVEVLARIHANQVIVRLGVLLIHKVYVVGGHQLDVVLVRHLDEPRIEFVLLDDTSGIVGGILRRMALKLQVVVVAEETLVPKDGLFSRLQVAVLEFARHLATQTGRAADQSFVILLQHLVVDARTHIVTFHPANRHCLDQILVALLVLGQQDQVPAAHIDLAFLSG